MPDLHVRAKITTQEEEIDAKQRLNSPPRVSSGEHVEVHPDEGDDGENAKHNDDDSRESSDLVGGCKGLLERRRFGVRIRSLAVGFGAHNGSFRE